MNPVLREMVAEARMVDSRGPAARRASPVTRSATVSPLRADHPRATGPASVRLVIGWSLVSVGLRFALPSHGRCRPRAGSSRARVGVRGWWY